MDFIQYVQNISDICGFQTLIDRLKIPSTKRICLIGSKRNYPNEDQSKRSASIQEFINQESGLANNIESEKWNSDFQPRPSTEKVQNCTKVDKTIQKEIVDIVFNEIMKTKLYLKEFGEKWNCGGKIPLQDLIKIIPHDKLIALKSESGGLKTLLKNKSQIFRVIAGIVDLRIPKKWSEKKSELEKLGDGKSKLSKIRFKETQCFFKDHHPDGCPLDDQDCSFKH